MMRNHTQGINKTLLLWYNMTDTEQLAIYIRNAIADLFPDHNLNIEVEGGENINVGRITVMPCVIEKPSIAGIKEIPGWEVTTPKFVASSSYWEMDDVDIVERGKSNNLVEIAKIVCKVLFEDRLESHFDKVGTEEWAKEEQKWADLSMESLRQRGEEDSVPKFLEDQILSEESAKVLDEILEQPASPIPEVRSPKMKKAEDH